MSEPTVTTTMMIVESVRGLDPTSTATGINGYLFTLVELTDGWTGSVAVVWPTGAPLPKPGDRFRVELREETDDSP